MGAPVATAEGATCVSYNLFGVCTLWAESPADPGDGGGSRSGSNDGPNGVPIMQIEGHYCMPTGLADPQPPQSEAVWEGRTDGAIYVCEVPAGRGGMFVVGYLISYWSLTAPAAPPDPETLAQQAVASMELQAVRIGIVPEAQPGSVGLVGMPNWMWVSAPDAPTFGPITRTASAGGWSVSATAQVASVSWDMGDGRVVTCAGSGTPYEASYGAASSPDCGHTYTRQGDYTVRATSHWVVTWSGIGQAGTISLDLTQATDVTIGEAQVLTQ
ncbi:PKD domain-containing protein [Cellulomonas fimi]|uniref:PKD domain-containing protein n=2 Tax=Cellulomonas fimi TaxID=1708 RepID=A0A7Y0M0T9_CELFI|nr:PKD domain-containing protein [Cellulomonas fimi]